MATSSNRDSMVSCPPSEGATVIACIIPVTDASGLITKRLSAAVRHGGVDVVAGRDQHGVQRVHDALRPRRRPRGEDHHRRLVGIPARSGRRRRPVRRHRSCRSGANALDQAHAPSGATTSGASTIAGAVAATMSSYLGAAPALVGATITARRAAARRGSRPPRRCRWRRARTPRRRRTIPSARSASTAPSTAASARRRSANARAPQPPPAPGRGERRRPPGRPARCPTTGGAGIAARGRRPGGRRSRSTGAHPPRECGTRDSERHVTVAAAWSRIPAVPGHDLGTGRAGRRAVGGSRRARRRPRPLAHRPPAPRRGRRASPPISARAASAAGTIVSWQLPDDARDDGGDGRAGAPRRGAEPAHPDPARARGRLHHPPGRRPR